MFAVADLGRLHELLFDLTPDNFPICLSLIGSLGIIPFTLVIGCQVQTAECRPLLRFACTLTALNFWASVIMFILLNIT
jgi:hypothetical protein